MLMHYKRAFKLLSFMKQNKAKVLILGNKNQFGIDWKGRFEGIDFDTGIVDEKVISSAPKHYQLILCLDPALYARSLHRISVPVMMCATAREITQHPEILRVTDYLLPSPSSRHDAALRQFIGVEELARAGGDASMSEEPKRGASGGQDRGDGAAAATPRVPEGQGWPAQRRAGPESASTDQEGLGAASARGYGVE
ncbi:unnamed protein product [Prorocentrum cordatum]|uniref:Uncharacterized protein n=1 Tax=Prorocentrum cordatum TaxID=2364126 RepID=A0ABN9SNF4_9DINO|nr:unnamed protein product [Polarella glacialis]